MNSISDRLVTLGAGESKDINLSFKINEDTDAGEYSFKLESVAGSKVDSKTVAVNVESSSLWASLSNSISEGSTLAWVIGIACVILLIIIIFLWVAFARN